MERDYLQEQIDIAEDKLGIAEGFFMGVGIGIVAMFGVLLAVIL